MSGERDLATLLRTMTPRLRPGEFVYVLVDPDVDPGTVPSLDFQALVREAEGTSLVMRRADADRAGLPYDFVAAWITLAVHSSLEAVGLTAAVARTLTDRDISCNVLAGAHHDHLLVPVDRADDALTALRALAHDR